LCLLKLLPLLLQIKLLSSKFLLLVKQCLLKIIHLVEFLSKQVFIFHVIGQQDVVIGILGLKFLQDCCLILNYEGNTF
jgi:hypothetical protein